MTAFITTLPMWGLVAIFLLTLVLLTRAADILVDHAIHLSQDAGISDVVIGATVVALGTTLAEVAIAVSAIFQGVTDFSVGNATGSVITNMSIVLGVGAIAGTIPVARHNLSRVQLLLTASLLLIFAACLTLMSGRGYIPRWVGIVFLLLIPAYLYLIIRQNNQDKKKTASTPVPAPPDKKTATWVRLLWIIGTGLVIAISANALVDASVEIAGRLHISDAIVSATVVALGTSFPELVTAYYAAKGGFGGLALGNIIGANVMNLLLVNGLTIAFSPATIYLPKVFYFVTFPMLLLVLLLVGWFIIDGSRDEIDNKEGIALVAVYGLYVAAYIFVL
ncbi:sodium:calcium antiporter [Schleiferilactobacillus harbinensis]|jgi:cation:H+ antiporter|uniref:Sodium:calcium antiporter n=2 Tax=Schleiferilactobacillus harbinensis TaxID=304207 RepID=A0ABU7SYQ4_9LACO|nr:sodium:calcium antiporter [Schleiferilactobacillus harbinensis]MCI1687808.1 sodium:calcium antiporter [Schleiferilactobacillus harbinensis]MCI1783078.1 sodium:calcium antiporter [Schleiferilactobacillus harbinensis]MCI1851668.1 sodium:calcium antiporter [Schleiferilactobacillus harbinensis]MCT2907485.1 sodium:calcium antiporter [Schleiferilactobacillus harbinensis]QFR62835.1 sodium:calcium antiporter [Schleiferilactobacillus harbinensis]